MTVRSRMLVVALGNELAGDDGFGPRVLARLREHPELASRLDLVPAGTDLLGLIDLFPLYDEVVLLDAVLDAGPAGEVRVIDEETLGRWPAPAPSGHEVSPLVALGLLRALHPSVGCRVRLVGLCVESIRLGEGLSHPAAVDAGVEAVRRLLEGD